MPRPEPRRDNLAAVVVVGGASRRMGRDKATMPHPGRLGLTMVEHTVTVVSGRCSSIFVIAAPGQELPTVDAVILRDEVTGGGPLVATGLGLRAAAAVGLDRAFVCAVDMPDLSAEMIDDLARHGGPDVAGHGGVDVVLPWDGRDHYLAGIYRTALADRIDALVADGERSMRALVDTVLTQRVVMTADSGLANLNKPSDLR